MKDFSNVVLGSVGEIPITVNDLLYKIKTNLEQSIVDDLVHVILLRKVSKDLGVSVTDQELQEAADNFRKRMGLISAKETNEWLFERGLTVDEFERKIEDDLLKVRAQDKLATPEKMNKLFAEQILEFEKAKIAKIVVNDKGLADEIKTQIDEGEADFAVLAAKYSTDKESAEKGGMVGYVNRKDLPDEVDVLVFGEDKPKIVGPVAAGGSYYIVRILEPKKADPKDPVTVETCKKVIFDEYMAEKGQEIGVKLEFLP